MNSKESVAARYILLESKLFGIQEWEEHRSSDSLFNSMNLVVSWLMRIKHEYGRALWIIN